MTREEAIDNNKNLRMYMRLSDKNQPYKFLEENYIALDMAIKALEQESKWIPVSEKYEHHIDHTDCIWYGNDSGCPVTCSQYRDGWNDAMDYIFKNGDGYRPYRRNENG